ncbi:MAG: hypothetical protein QM765_16935 [Myxococcales bacterium]
MQVHRVVLGACVALGAALSATASASEPERYPPPPPPVVLPVPPTAPPPPPLAPPPPPPAVPAPAVAPPRASPGTALIDDDDRPKAKDDRPLQTGLAMKIGVAVPVDNPRDPQVKLHAGAGVRYGFFQRPPDGWGFNLAAALLVGGDLTPNLDEAAFNLELRLEGLYAGKSQLLMPIARLYGLGGLRVVNTQVRSTGAIATNTTGYFGAGIGFNMLPLIGKEMFSGGSSWGAGGGAVLVILLLLSPTLEVLYLGAPNGSWAPAYVIAFGL